MAEQEGDQFGSGADFVIATGRVRISPDTSELDRFKADFETWLSGIERRMADLGRAMSSSLTVPTTQPEQRPTSEQVADQSLVEARSTFNLDSIRDDVQVIRDGVGILVSRAGGGV